MGIVQSKSGGCGIFMVGSAGGKIQGPTRSVMVCEAESIFLAENDAVAIAWCNPLA